MLSDWVSFLVYPNLFGIKGFVVLLSGHWTCFMSIGVVLFQFLGQFESGRARF
jgi:hypothetical protein